MARTNQPERVARSWFNPELDVHFTGEEAVKVGLADGVFKLPQPSGDDRASDISP
jgi:hypothetical protein